MEGGRIIYYWISIAWKMYGFTYTILTSKIIYGFVTKPDKTCNKALNVQFNIPYENFAKFLNTSYFFIPNLIRECKTKGNQYHNYTLLWSDFFVIT